MRAAFPGKKRDGRSRPPDSASVAVARLPFCPKGFGGVPLGGWLVAASAHRPVPQSASRAGEATCGRDRARDATRRSVRWEPASRDAGVWFGHRPAARPPLEALRLRQSPNAQQQLVAKLQLCLCIAIACGQTVEGAGVPARQRPRHCHCQEPKKDVDDDDKESILRCVFRLDIGKDVAGRGFGMRFL